MSVDFTQPCWEAETLVAAPLVWALRPAPESSAPVSTSSNRVLSARLCASITPTCQTSRIAYRRAHDRTRGFSWI
jgi:hypothetical protein